MGGVIHRSSGQRDEEKTKRKKEKRKRRHEQEDIQFEHDGFPIPDGNENEDPNIHLMNTYELWDNKFDQKQMININDPPGAPHTYSPNYSMTPNDMMMQAWPASHDINNSFYPINSHRATPPYNIPYDPNQHVHAQVSNTISNQSPAVTHEERVPKKVQFVTPNIQKQKSPLQPLSSTQSWHEHGVINAKMPLPIATQPVRLSKQSSAPRPSTVMRNPSPAPASVPKPIYIGIDHQATLAERGVIIANKRHRKNGEKNHSDGLNSTTNTHQSRSQHKQATDSPRPDNDRMPSKSFDSFQPKVSGLQHTKVKSMSKNQNIDQMPSINNEMKLLKSTSNRRQQSSINNEIKPMKSREIHRPNSRQRLPNGSNLLVPTDSSKRRIEHIHSNSPVMRIPLSTNNRKQPIILSGLASKASVSRTRM